MVLVDTDVIAKALAKPLMAEMGDTIATYFEARACRAPLQRQSSGREASAGCRGSCDHVLAVSAKRGKSGKGSSRRWYMQCVVEDHFRDKYLCNTFLIEKIRH